LFEWNKNRGLISFYRGIIIIYNFDSRKKNIAYNKFISFMWELLYFNI